MSRDLAPSIKDDAESRPRTLRTYSAPTAVACTCCLIYYGLTWDQPHRLFMAGTTLAAALAALSLLRLPIDRVVRSRWGEAFSIGWVGALSAIIAAACAAGGGITSPLVALFFLPLTGAALSLPPSSMIAAGALNLGAYLALLAFSGHVSAASVFIVAATLVIITWICARQASIRDRQRRALARASRTDMLTGVLNRRGFEERFDAELARAQRDVADLSLVLVDLDDFKAVNDTQGHPVGDELLRWVSEAIAGELRASDAIGRLGGDEFAVMLVGGGSNPREVLERLLTRLSERTGASAGAASFPADGHERDDLFKRADVALYERKQTRPPPGLPRQRGLSWATSLATTADERMGGAHSHSDAVSDYAAGAARQLGWQEAELGLLRLAAVLHDVGKVDVPMHILRKRGPLDDSEYAEMTKHAAAGAHIAACVDGLETIVPWIRHSHERVDGRGYPDQLQGEQIPLASRIILVADAYDAMTSDRPYRAAMTHDEALAELHRHAGTFFDAKCVEALARYLSEDRVCEPGTSRLAS